MGRTFTALTLFVALSAILTGAWILGSILFVCFGYLLLHKTERAQTRQSRTHSFGGWNLSGLILILLSLVALISGGILSPVVFGLLGMMILLRGRTGGLSIPILLEHDRDSVILRDGLLPWRRFLVAEIRFVSRRPVDALTVIEGTLLFRFDGKARVYLILRQNSLTAGAAEDEFVHRLREVTKALTPLDAYIMPVNGEDAVAVVQCGGTRLKLPGEKLFHALATSPLDVLVIDIQDLRVRKIGAFASLDGGNKGVLGGKVLRERISSWEVLKAIEKRAEFEEPNELTTFLGSLAATRGEPIGERLPVVEEDSTRGLLVRSLRAPAVRLTPSQARILSEAYI